MADLSKFQRVVKMVAFNPFDSAENALENINAITDHELTADLRVIICVQFIKTNNLLNVSQNFLEINLSKGKKSKSFPLGVVLAIRISEGVCFRK